jgi:RNA polymerase sigma-70 factor, ECF subfamily
MQEYERYGRALIRKAERILRNGDDARDVVHSIFVDMLQSNDGPADLPYLYRVVTHRCLSFLRDEKNRSRLLAQHDDALRGPARTRLDERVIDLDMLVKLVAALDDESAQVLVYRYLDDMTQEEIAAVLGLSRKTIGKRLDAITGAVTRLAGQRAIPENGAAS